MIRSVHLLSLLFCLYDDRERDIRRYNRTLQYVATIWRYNTMLRYDSTKLTHRPCDWRRAIFMQVDPASAKSRLDFIPHPFFPPGEQFDKQTTQRRAEGEAGSPLQAGREDTAGLAPVYAYFSTQLVYHELWKKTSPQFPRRTRTCHSFAV
jgi:hypothetical protein